MYANIVQKRAATKYVYLMFFSHSLFLFLNLASHDESDQKLIKSNLFFLFFPIKHGFWRMVIDYDASERAQATNK